MLLCFSNVFFVPSSSNILERRQASLQLISQKLCNHTKLIQMAKKQGKCVVLILGWIDPLKTYFATGYLPETSCKPTVTWNNHITCNSSTESKLSRALLCHKAAYLSQIHDSATIFYTLVGFTKTTGPLQVKWVLNLVWKRKWERGWFEVESRRRGAADSIIYTRLCFSIRNQPSFYF